MRLELRHLRAQQLQRGLHPFVKASKNPRPRRGWIRAIREVTGLTLQQLGRRLDRTISAVAYLEKAEAEYSISLGSLREVADSLGCELVYALVPRTGRISDLIEQPARTKAARNVRAVEHTMALEDQAVGGIDKKIEEHTRSLLKRR
jgi:predicted DNA-binding mobile mystery protein A